MERIDALCLSTGMERSCNFITIFFFFLMEKSESANKAEQISVILEMKESGLFFDSGLDWRGKRGQNLSYSILKEWDI